MIDQAIGISGQEYAYSDVISEISYGIFHFTQCNENYIEPM